MEENVNLAQTEGTQAVKEVVSENTSFENIVKNLLKNPNCKKYNGLKVKSVSVKENDEYVAVNLSIMSKIPGFVPVLTEDGDPTGEYKRGMTNVIYSTNYAIAGVFKNDEELAFVGNMAARTPACLVPILSASIIDVIIQFVPANTDYLNPFTTKDNPEPVQFDHDVFISHIVGVKLGSVGLKTIDKLLDKYVEVMTI